MLSGFEVTIITIVVLVVAFIVGATGRGVAFFTLFVVFLLNFALNAMFPEGGGLYMGVILGIIALYVLSHILEQKTAKCIERIEKLSKELNEALEKAHGCACHKEEKPEDAVQESPKAEPRE